MLPPKPQPAAYDPKRAALSHRRNLPHVVQENAIYFVTLRQFDSIPQEKLSLWTEELENWNRQNPPPHSPEQIEAMADLGYRRIERWLDRCDGTCLLRSKSAQEIIAACLNNRDGQDYWLGDYIVMPNHVHLLVQVIAPAELKVIARAWIGVTTHRINNATRRKGKLWQDEPFDHIIRNDGSLAQTRLYIQNNGKGLPETHWKRGTGKLFAMHSESRPWAARST